MGEKIGSTKLSLKTKIGKQGALDDPYSHLAAAIIIQAFDDLRALDGEDTTRFVGQDINKWEILNFIRSGWCGLLLGFQVAVSQDDLESAASAVLTK